MLFRSPEANPIVAEAEPALEALADLSEPDAVTEDAAEFGLPADAPAPAAGDDGADQAAALLDEEPEGAEDDRDR